MLVKVLLLTFVPGLVVFSSFFGKAAFEAYFLKLCDPKFGCQDGLLVAAFITGLAFALSVVGNAVVVMLQLSTIRSISLPRLFVVVILVGGLLDYAFTTVPAWPWADLGPMFWWLVLSGVLSWVTLFIARRLE